MNRATEIVVFCVRSSIAFFWFFFASALWCLLTPFVWGRRGAIWTAYLQFVSPLFLKILGVSFEVARPLHYQTRPTLYVVNHQSLLDVFGWGTCYPPDALTVGKVDLAFVPFFGICYAGFGNFLIHRKNKKKAYQTLEAVNRHLKGGGKVVFFPEGTRNRSEKVLLKLKRGAFLAAVQAQVPIVIGASGLYAPYLDFGKFRLKVGTRFYGKTYPPIETKGKTEEDIPKLMEEVRQILVGGIEELTTRIRKEQEG